MPSTPRKVFAPPFVDPASIPVAPELASQIEVVARPVVTIIGAGISGLTVAHELVERGFAVQVVEKREDARDGDKVYVGGVAATQWGSLPQRACGDVDVAFLGQVQHAIPLDLTAMVRTGPVGGALTITPEGVLSDALALTELARRAVRAANLWRRSAANRSEVELAVRVLATPAGAAHPCFQAHQLCDQVVEALVSALEMEASKTSKNSTVAVSESRKGGLHIDPKSREALEPELRRIRVIAHDAILDGARPRPELDCCDPGLLGVLSIWSVTHQVPGEHGYRFFPSFYRHLFDTMQRTPLYGLDGHETGATVYDNLRSTSIQGVGLQGKGVVRVPRRAVRSAEELRAFLKTAKGVLEFEDTDIAWFELKMLKYMTACGGRREEWSTPNTDRDGTFWDFMGAKIPNRYSAAFLKHLRMSSQGLVAMRESEIDARTYGNISVQLMIDQLKDGSRTDMLLNGPTTEAWMDHWKAYLQRQGVRFFHGQLREDGDGLVPADTSTLHWVNRTQHDAPPSVPLFDLAPAWDGPGPSLDDLGLSTYNQYDPCGEAPPRTFKPTYYVLATPLERVWKHLPAPGTSAETRLDGAMKDLADWRKTHWVAGYGAQSPFTHTTRIGPFRHYPGIQFYTVADLKFTPGHTYYADSDWALSSVSQPQFWRVRITDALGFRGLLSVDIGNVYGDGSLGAKPVFGETPDNIRDEVWRQSFSEVFAHTVTDITGNLYDLASTIPAPLYYHLDDYLHTNGVGQIDRNDCPYLINLPGDWTHRGPRTGGANPGTGFFDAISAPSIPNPSDLVLAHQVCHHRWVVAGPHMRTTTRLSSMEAANESGRHAVNAILIHLALSVKPDSADAGPAVYDGPYDGNGQMMGDICEIWNPEEHELPDLQWLKRVDAELHKAGHPHLIDILKLEDRLAEGIDAAAIVEAVVKGTVASFAGTFSPSQTQLLQQLQQILGL